MTERRVYAVVSMCCGIGGQLLGVLRAESEAGSVFESAGAFDNDPLACADLEMLTGAKAQLVDLAVISPAELAARCTRRPDMVICSAPCLPADGLVITESGPRRIDSIAAGDRVLTHAGRYCNVDKVNARSYTGTMHGLRLNGTLETDVQWYTDEHPIWVRKTVHKRQGGLLPARWVPAAEVVPGDRVGFPVPREAVGTAETMLAHCGPSTRTVDLRSHATSEMLWSLVGAYIGDGDRRHRGPRTVRFSIGARGGEKHRLVVDALASLGLKFSEWGPPKNVRVSVSHEQLWHLCGLFGDGCLEKRIPELVMGLEDACMRAMIRGLRATDGNDRPHGWRLASISLDLLRGVQRIMLRCGVLGSISRMLRAGRGVIEGREVNISDSYSLDFLRHPEKTCYRIEDGVAWLRVKSVERREAAEPVWNLEVDDDDTYCSPLIATHNCKGFSGCLSEKLSETEHYQRLNMLALRCINLVLEAWDVPPAIILFENVPRITSRGKKLLERIKALLWQKGYEIDTRTHDCGDIGHLAQRRERFLLVARHRTIAPTPLLKPPALGHRAMAEVLWQLPIPTPGSSAGGPLHKLPSLAALNWLRLAAIRAGNDWKDLPAEIGMVESEGRQSGLYGVCDSDGPSHTIVSRARAGSSSWASVSDPRLPTRKQRQNGGFGVNDTTAAGHAVVAEGSVRNTWVSAADPRLAHGTRERGPWGVHDPLGPSTTVIGKGQLSNSVRAVADPRLPERATRHAGIYGVLDGEEPAHSVIGQARTGKGWADVADPRLVCAQRNGALGVASSSRASPTITGRGDVSHPGRAVADERDGFRPTHRLICSSSLDASRSVWTSGRFELIGPPTLFGRSGRPTILLIVAPDGTIHRPLTSLELAVLQGFPAWHRVGDPTELELWAEGGQWLDLAGGDGGKKRERIGNAIPPATAQAIATMVLEVLDAGATELFRLSSGGIWVSPLEAASA